jgi:ribosome-binding factor A
MADQLKELAMKFLQRESNRTSLITVTSIDLHTRSNVAIIYFTVLPADKEKAALDFLKRMRGPFRDFVKDNARLRAIPTFDFEIDKGEKNRQKIDELTINDPSLATPEADVPATDGAVDESA